MTDDTKSKSPRTDALALKLIAPEGAVRHWEYLARELETALAEQTERANRFNWDRIEFIRLAIDLNAHITFMQDECAQISYKGERAFIDSMVNVLESPELKALQDKLKPTDEGKT